MAYIFTNNSGIPVYRPSFATISFLMYEIRGLMYKMKKAPNFAPKNMLQNIIVANMVLAKTKKSGLLGKSTLFVCGRS